MKRMRQDVGLLGCLQISLSRLALFGAVITPSWVMGQVQSPQNTGQPGTRAELTTLSACPTPTREQIEADRQAMRNPLVRTYQTAVCMRDSSQNMMSVVNGVRGNCVHGTGDSTSIDLQCFQRQATTLTEGVQAQVANVLLGLPSVQERERVRQACPMLFGSTVSMTQMEVGLRCLTQITSSQLGVGGGSNPVFREENLGVLRGMLTRVRVAGAYCASNGRALPGADLPPASEAPFPEAPPARITGQNTRQVEQSTAAVTRWMQAYQRRQAAQAAELQRVGTPRLQECGATQVPSVATVEEAALRQLAGNARSAVSGAGGAALAQSSPGNTTDPNARGAGRGNAQGVVGGTGSGTSGERANRSWLDDLLRSPPIPVIQCEYAQNARPTAVCATCRQAAGVASSSTQPGAQAQALQAQVQAAVSNLNSNDLKERAAYFRLQSDAQEYFAMLSRQGGMTADRFRSEANALVTACGSNGTADMRAMLADMARAATDDFGRAMPQPAPTQTSSPSTASNLPPPTYTVLGQNPNDYSSVAAQNREVYVRLAIEASEEVARIDQEIETLMGDFDRPPASIAQAYSNFIERNATRALGETAGQFVPPLCHAYLEVFDTFRGAWATTHSTAVCSTRQLGMGPSDLAPDQLPTANTPQANAPLTAADQLLARYSVPRVLRNEASTEAGDHPPVLSQDGQPILVRDAAGTLQTETTALVSPQTSVRERCRIKSDILSGLSARRAQLLGQFRELGEKVDSQGNPSEARSSVPLHQLLARQQGSARRGLLERQLGVGATNPRLAAVRESAQRICRDPRDEGALMFRDDQLLNHVMSCSSTVSQDTEARWRPIAERSARVCSELKAQGEQVCATRQEVRSSATARMSDDIWPTIEAGFRGAGMAMDAMGCAGVGRLAVNAGRGLFRLGSNSLSHAGRQALLNGLGEVSGTTLARDVARTAFRSIVNPMNGTFAVQGGVQIAVTRDQAREANRRFYEGLGSAEERDALREATRHDVRRLAGNLTAGMVVAHFMTGGGLVREPVTRINSPEVSRAFRRLFGRDPSGALVEGRATTGSPGLTVRQVGANGQTIGSYTGPGSVEPAPLPPAERARATREFERVARARVAEQLGLRPQDLARLTASDLRAIVESSVRQGEGQETMFSPGSNPSEARDRVALGIPRDYLGSSLKFLFEAVTGRTPTGEAIPPENPTSLMTAQERARYREPFARAMKARIAEQLGLNSARAEQIFRNMGHEDLVRLAEDGGRLTAELQSRIRDFRVENDPPERQALAEIIGELYRRGLRGNARAAVDYVRRELDRIREERRRPPCNEG